MSKIAANETYGGNMLRKAIDYFCHLAVAPDFMGRIEKGDKAFAASEFFPQMRWLKDVNDDIYDPTYTDMLRVAFTAEFGRGKGFLSRDITVNDLIMNRMTFITFTRASTSRSKGWHAGVTTKSPTSF